MTAKGRKLFGVDLVRHWHIILLWIVFCVFDATQRLMFSDAEKIDIKVAKPSAFSKPPRLGTTTYDVYMEKLARFAAKPESEEVRLQEDSLVDFDDLAGGSVWQGTGYDYRLLGIFGGLGRLAVLHRTNQETAAVDVIDARVGDSLHGFTISSISKRSVVAMQDNKEYVELVLFQPTHSAGAEADL